MWKWIWSRHTISWISQTFPYWSGRLLHADRRIIDFGGTIRLCLTSGKQTMPLTEFLLSGWVSITLLSAVNLMNQWQEEDILTRASRAATERQKPCQAHWLTDEERGWIFCRHTVHPHPPFPLTHFPANGGINPCSVLWDGRSSLPTALHFIHHWMHTHKAGGMMVSAAFTHPFSTKLEVVH